MAGVISTEAIQAVFPEPIRGKANPIAENMMNSGRYTSNKKHSRKKPIEPVDLAPNPLSPESLMISRENNNASMWERNIGSRRVGPYGIRMHCLNNLLGRVRRRCGLGRVHLGLAMAGVLCSAFCGISFAADPASAKSVPPPGTYLNPLGAPPFNLEDPYMLVHSKRYYLFGTASPSEGFQCYESADLVNWKLDGWAWHKSGLRVARGELHSPQVFPYQDMFCLVYSARMAQGTQLGLAASTRPEGPYHDLHAPWLSLGDSCTAGDVFIDRNGKAYLTFTQTSRHNGCTYSSIFGVALTKDLSKTIGEPVKLLEPTQRWELARRDSAQCNEASRVFKIGAKYYLTYCANDAASPDRAVGYASADKPLGPWTKSPDNPLLTTRSAIGVIAPNHCSVFRSLDKSEWFVLYDTFADAANPSGPHVINLDRLVLQPNHKLGVQGPTRSPQPLPAAVK